MKKIIQKDDKTRVKKRFTPKPKLWCSLSLMSCLLTSNYCFSIGSGTFDARAMGMGGATVAAATTDHAHFYNPALIAFEEEDEDTSRNGRFLMPTFAALGSDAGKAAVDIVSENLDQEISDSIATFNTQTGSTAAANDVLNALNDFDQAIEDLNQQSIELDAYVGISISEPANKEGGTFYVGMRGLVFGFANVTDEDLAVLDNYISAMQDIVAGTADINTVGNAVAANGQLIDPRPNLTSQAQLSSLAIGEWGIAMSKQFDVFGQDIAFGLTPKMMQVQVYREDLTFSDDEITSYSENKRDHLTMNFDFGMAADVFDIVRVGLSVQDVLPKRFTSQNNLAIELKPRTRLGFAYVNNFLTVGLDFDVQKNKPIASEPESQEVSLGMEIRPWDSVDLRFGYRQDSASERGDILSAGIRYQIWRFVAEAAFATSDDSTGGSLQMGWAF